MRSISFGIHSFNPGRRIYARIEPFIDEIKKRGTKKQKEELGLYEDNLISTYKKLRITYIGRNIAFTLVYFAFFATLFRNIRVLMKAIEVISIMVGILGTAVIFFIMTILDKFTELYVDDMHLLSTHILAIYHKLPVTNQKEAIKKRKSTKKSKK